MKTGLLAVLAGGLVLLAGAPADALQVTVSILPQKYFAERIGGDLVDVAVMVEPGASPATYEPRPRQMAQLARSSIYFAIGVPFESAWLEKIAGANKRMRIIRTADAVARIMMAAHHHEDAGPGEHGRDGGGIPDPHVWLSPPLVRILCETMRDALVSADPAHAAAYRSNYIRFAREINRCDEDILNLLQDSPPEARRFMAYHPAWGYFARTYGLHQVTVELEGKEPGPRQLAALIRRARQTGIRTVFVQPQFSEKNARVLARGIGAAVVRADPLAYDWPANLAAVARQFAGALR